MSSVLDFGIRLLCMSSMKEYLCHTSWNSFILFSGLIILKNDLVFC